jgi:hypothetical protein
MSSIGNSTSQLFTTQKLGISPSKSDVVSNQKSQKPLSTEDSNFSVPGLDDVGFKKIQEPPVQ